MTLTLPKPTSPFVWNSRIRGNATLTPILIKGIHRLGIPRVRQCRHRTDKSGGKLNVYKSKGKVTELEHFVEDKDTSVRRHRPYALGHARRAQRRNAHPHCSENGSIALIHNGTIENYGYWKSHARGERLHASPQRKPTPRYSYSSSNTCTRSNRNTLFESGTAALNPRSSELWRNRSTRPHQQR